MTGPAVIDFNDQLKTVEDRCGYTLLTGSPIQGLTVVANFQERRRRDVSFLDSVTLRLQGQDDVHLEQGGIVKVSYLQPQSGVSVDCDPKSSSHPLLSQLSSFFSVTLEAVV